MRELVDNNVSDTVAVRVSRRNKQRIQADSLPRVLNLQYSRDRQYVVSHAQTVLLAPRAVSHIVGDERVGNSVPRKVLL